MRTGLGTLRQLTSQGSPCARGYSFEGFRYFNWLCEVQGTLEAKPSGLRKEWRCRETRKGPRSASRGAGAHPPPGAGAGAFAGETLKSKSLSSRNLSFLGRSHCVLPATGRIEPSFREPHLEEGHGIGDQGGLGVPGARVGGGGSPVHLLSLPEFLLPLRLKEVLVVVAQVPGWGTGTSTGLPGRGPRRPRPSACPLLASRRPHPHPRFLQPRAPPPTPPPVP